MVYFSNQFSHAILTAKWTYTIIRKAIHLWIDRPVSNFHKYIATYYQKNMTFSRQQRFAVDS